MSDRTAEFERAFRAFYGFVLRHAVRGTKLEDVLGAARRAAERLLAENLAPVDWSTALPARVRELRRPARLHAGVRVAVELRWMAVPGLLSLPGSDGQSEEMLATSLRTADGLGDEIETLDIVGEGLVDTLEKLRSDGRTVELLGRVVAVPESPVRRRFVLQVFDARPSTSAFDIIAASAAEREAAGALAADLACQGVSPLSFIVSELERGLEIVALDKNPLLRRLLEFVVLQAVSSGRISHAPARLHAMIVGPPGHGKKLCGLAARILNPRAKEASAAKISAAGLVGASHTGPEGWTSRPGLLAQADEGVLVLQDAHAISQAELRRLGPVLQALIEDGVLRDSVAGGVQREVSVGLVVDLNRAAHLTAGRPGSEAPIIELRPLLSRVDLLVEMPADHRLAWHIGSEMYSRLRSRSGPVESEGWVRQLRLLVAELRDHAPLVDLTPVAELMRERHNDIQRANQALFDTLTEAGDLPTRLALTFGRLVAAHARTHGRAVAAPEDVDGALPFLTLKLEFLHMLVPEAAGADDAGRRDPWQAVKDELGAEPFGAADVASAYERTTGVRRSGRSARRDLRRLGARPVGRGQYVLPPISPR